MHFCIKVKMRPLKVKMFEVTGEKYSVTSMHGRVSPHCTVTEYEFLEGNCINDPFYTSFLLY